MPEFAYRAIDPDGREKRGRISAANDDAARERLGRVRLYVVEVELAEPRSASRNALKLPQRRKLNAKQLTLFTRQLASLVEVAPLEEAVRNLSRQQEREDVRSILGNVHNGLVEGLRFSDCLAREPASFPPLYRAMIAAGEGAGTLPIICERLADLLERQAKMRGKLIAPSTWSSPTKPRLASSASSNSSRSSPGTTRRRLAPGLPFTPWTRSCTL